MINSISSSSAAMIDYGKKMASVSNRISKAFREDADSNIAVDLAKSTVLEHGYRASHKVIHSQDEMIKSVLDIVA